MLRFLLSVFAFQGDKMNSALNLINPQRFHVLIPKVKGVIVLTNEVSVRPSGNKRKKEKNTGTFFLSRSSAEYCSDLVTRGPANGARARLLSTQGRLHAQRYHHVKGNGLHVTTDRNMSWPVKLMVAHNSGGREKMKRLPISSTQTF